MVLLAIIILLVLGLDFINGFHDAANSIATVVTTKVLTPTVAVIWAAFFNFVAFFIAKYITGFGIVDTVSKVVLTDVVGDGRMIYVVFAGVVAAIIWSLLTWWFGIPSSSSHTLIGGFAASAITLFITQALKVPVSTTHVVSGSIMGVGATKRPSAVRWGVSVELVTAWIITIPVSAVMGMATYWLVGFFL